MTPPTIHLNGTAPQDLLDSLFDALDALYVARDVLAKTAPNGRDYPNTINAAIKIHDGRMDTIKHLADELSDDVREILEQMEAAQR